MSSSSLAVDRVQTVQKLQPNLLPCRIAHNGPVNATSRYWAPKIDANGAKTVYFRGRKLQAKQVALPEGYSGAVLRKTDRTILEAPQPAVMDDDDDMSDHEEPPKHVKIIEQIATFDGFTIWDHEAVPQSGQDPYLKGVEEWIKLSEAVRRQQIALIAFADTSQIHGC